MILPGKRPRLEDWQKNRGRGRQKNNAAPLMKKFVVLILFLGVSAGLTWLVWFRPVKPPEEEKKPEAEVPVHVGKITRATLRAYVTAYGTVEPDPKASARVAVAVPGVVAAVNCVEGQRAEKDALLFALDSRTADVAVKFAE